MIRQKTDLCSFTTIVLFHSFKVHRRWSLHKRDQRNCHLLEACTMPYRKHIKVSFFFFSHNNSRQRKKLFWWWKNSFMFKTLTHIQINESWYLCRENSNSFFFIVFLFFRKQNQIRYFWLPNCFRSNRFRGCNSSLSFSPDRSFFLTKIHSLKASVYCHCLSFIDVKCLEFLSA